MSSFQRQPKQWRRDSHCRMRAVTMFLKCILRSKATYGTDNQHINVTSGENVEAPLNRRAALGALAGSSTQLLNRNHSSARWPAWSPPVLTALAAAQQPAARKTHQHFITELWLEKNKKKKKTHAFHFISWRDDRWDLRFTAASCQCKQ